MTSSSEQRCGLLAKLAIPILIVNKIEYLMNELALVNENNMTDIHAVTTSILLVQQLEWKFASALHDSSY